MTYGIASAGKPARSQALEIIRRAWEEGVRFYDTAQAYGESESILGEALEGNGPCVISKLSPELDPLDVERIRCSIEQSLERLRSPRLWALLLHRSEWLDRWDRGLGEALQDARDKGMLRYLGVSVYTVEEAERALAHPSIDVVQVPCNAWDQRMHREGVFDQARERDKLCFVRGIYLQGLMVLDPDEAERRLPGSGPVCRRWRETAARFGTRPFEVCVRFAKGLHLPLVVGMDSSWHLEEACAALKLPPLTEKEMEVVHDEMSPLLHEHILNPTLWSAA
jgi:aryl-alcohol dehydrogenase-like predicted oxidoreductase